jgi:hypothetical protein
VPETTIDIWIITAIAAAAGGFMGAFGFWLISKLEAFIFKPLIAIEYGLGRLFGLPM